jgi:hypothetical protein
MHHWQDGVLALGALMFAIALIPSVTSKDKPALWTSILTCTVLIVFAITYASLSLWFATITTSLTALLWGVLIIQKYLKK